MSNIIVSASGSLSFLGRDYHCALGRSGLSADKHEGGGATPIGTFALRRVFYRPDRCDAIPVTNLAIQALTPADGWCDDPSLPEYNQHIQLPFNGSHEKLWREDEIYDLIVVLGYNDDPIIPGKGSAIFMHLARPDYSPTEGCVALARVDLLALLADLPLGVSMLIKA